MDRLDPGVRLSGLQLAAALDELTSKLKDFRLTGQTPAEVMEAYAAEHGRTARK
ncbi:hypothetical protein [Nesterenkonia sphaerica]|uniref:hypothetical protein n=1 Tax=Nesterenkonia sphaerica TaxID=1804988 RepID=UPI00140A58E1|nr:hypothetical protein [Nesterenkonia sphaerica]